MGNCQDEFQNASQYDSQNEKSQVLVDRSHKPIFDTKHQKHAGFIMNEEQKNLDNQVMHKSIAISRRFYAQSVPSRKKYKNVEIEPMRLQILNMKFYHSLGLPEYSYLPKPSQMMEDQWGQSGFIHEAQDKTGVVYIGQRNSKGFFHGNGILQANTVYYIGQFYQGTKHNHGREVYTSEVYEGEFQFDFRKGRGIRYTEEFVDEGEFDKLITEGIRRFKNGNVYEGTFWNNQMDTVKASHADRFRGNATFYDASNDLIYEEDLIFEEGRLIKAKRVRNFKTGKHVGCFVGNQIVRREDERYQNLIRNWNRDDLEKLVQISANQKSMEESDIIRKQIQEWE